MSFWVQAATAAAFAASFQAGGWLVWVVVIFLLQVWTLAKAVRR